VSGDKGIPDSPSMFSGVILKGEITYDLNDEVDCSLSITSEANILPVLVFSKIMFESVA